jgi:hypothetical protein
MKKVLIAVCFMIGLTGLATAQTGKKKEPQQVKTEKARPSAASMLVDRPKKADGTIDRRFKKNKGLKKDGTLDMRFEKNKKKAA